jgi:sortase (surface protein transpeptidase)
MWIPKLGVSRSVSSFACTRSEPPANHVYRWGCAGKNNVYLFGHAWGVMKPLHDAYYSGALKKGMVVVYADGNGRVRSYKVTEIRIVTPDKVDWAIAAQATPSMTLQTCIGPLSDKRLLVRLVATN